MTDQNTPSEKTKPTEPRPDPESILRDIQQRQIRQDEILVKIEERVGCLFTVMAICIAMVVISLILWLVNGA